MAASDRAIRLGGVMPLSRPGFLEAGRHLKAGLELAVADVNGLGGVGGRPLELLIRDTGAGPAEAVAIVDELHKDGVAAIAGEYHSIVARAIAARATQLGLAFVLVGRARFANRRAESVGGAPRSRPVALLAGVCRVLG